MAKNSSAQGQHEGPVIPLVAPPFIAPELLEHSVAAQVRHRLSTIVRSEIVPRLIALHGSDADTSSKPRHPRHDVQRLALLTLDPDASLSEDFFLSLRRDGVSPDTLFVEVLEPAARHLGTMWERDECDFLDVALGVGRLQQILATFNLSHTLPAANDKRRICMMALSDEQHSLGVAIVEKLLAAGGWTVHAERGTTLQQIAPLMRTEWFAVVGLTAGIDSHLEGIAATIRQIREHSLNRAVGIMVGGPPFIRDPKLATSVGADGTAVNAAAAVVLAQRLFDAASGQGTDLARSIGNGRSHGPGRQG